MAILNPSRFLHRHRARGLLLVITITALVCITINSFFSTLHSVEDGSPELFSHERSKREVQSLDPVEDPELMADDVFMNGEMERFSRKVLNETESFFEVGGSKRPLPLKSLNKAFTEAKRLYYAKKNCIPRPPTTLETTTIASGGGAAKSTEAPAPAGDAKRRRRGALQMTTERVYYCDEFTTTVPTTSTLAPAGGAAPSTQAP